MALHETLIKQGNWLFAWRSYVPVPFFLLALYLAAGHDPAVPAAQILGGRGWELLCVAVSLLGQAIRAAAVGPKASGTSGRNTRAQVADSLNTSGLYALVRNPLYLGNFVLTLGVVLFVRSGWFAAFYVALFYVYYERIIYAEEAFLREKFGAAFLDWAARTPMLLPALRRWEKPAQPFSPRRVLRREFRTFAALLLAFAAVKAVEGVRLGAPFAADPFWNGIFLADLAFYVTVAALVKLTPWLDERRGEKEA
jgi:protein-S-isoprenylcysteine O-methyltransferase Ste14